MIERLVADDFQKLIGTDCSMDCGNAGTFNLKVSSVRDLSPSSKHVQFSVVFLGPIGAPARQGIYRVTHGQLGEMELFLVPVSRDANGIEFEAIFNRALKDGSGE